MLPVEIVPIPDALILRARGSELLILTNHVLALKGLKSAGDFSKYFLEQALVNRPARKLFGSWLRKDATLWSSIFKAIQLIEMSPDADKSASKAASTTASIRAAAHATTVVATPSKNSAAKTVGCTC